ncbi:MAG: hypothetical protein JNL50_13975 [Phycisphaerae bacterium]|nr:hypothetical protein [Phycisphaerae bacterium]
MATLRDGEDPKRIRKDAGDLRFADFERFPAWEFCYDEEGVEGQTECTMRPLPDAREVQWPHFDGLVAVDMIAANADRFLGIIQPYDTMKHAWACDPQVMLQELVGARVKDPTIDRYNCVLRPSSPRVGLTLGVTPETKVGPLITLAYQALRSSSDQFWPLTIVPRVRIIGFPHQWTMNGWLRGLEYAPDQIVR